MRRLILLLVLLSSCLVQAGETREFWQAEFILADTPAPPTAADPRWHAERLPHFLRDEAPDATGGWFRLRLDTAPPAVPQGVYIRWLNLNGAVYFNGEYLGDGGRLDEPITRNWNRPFFFLLPQGLWRTGENTLLIRLRSDPGWGMLSPVEVGDYIALRQAFELRSMLQVEVTRALTLSLLLAAALVLAVWWRRRRDVQYLWFGLACLAWAVFSFYLVVRAPPIPGPALRWLSHLALDVCAVCLVLFGHRYLGRVRPRLERGLLVFPVLAGLTSALAGAWQGYVILATHLVGFGLLLWLAWLALRHWQASRWREHALLLWAMGVLLAAGAHDLFVGMPPYWFPDDLARTKLLYHFFLLQYAVPVVLLFLTGHLSRRFAYALNDAESLNRELESRIEAGGKALAESFERRSLLERETAAAEERDRIYRDLHDDIGAKLLSLTLRAKTPQDADIARSALQDLRDVVSRSAQADAPLTDLLADWRAEIEGRCAAGGVHLLWTQPDDLPEREMTAAEALNLGRILREAVSNVLRHAQADSLAVGIDFTGSGYRIGLADDGIGQPRSPGRGMRNMQMRAAQLGGKIEWLWGEAGCRVVLSLPGGAAPAGIRTAG